MSAEAATELPAEVQDKVEACRKILRDLGRVVVAFSAGVDSTFLLALAVDTLDGEAVLAAMGISPSLADREHGAGRKLAKDIGAELVEIDTHELADPNYAANPADRCFYCKTDLFVRLNDLAKARGFDHVLSGANADDTGDFRPGIRAGRDLGVRSPLMEAGLTKSDVRAASRAMGLPTWNKPAMACLASRIPYGQGITAERLGRVERAEYVLKDLGLVQCRVRDHGPVARIEVSAGDIARVAELREQIVPAFKALGFSYVSLDLEGFRSGSMNETLSAEERSRDTT